MKDPLKRVKRQAMYCEKMFGNHMHDKELVCRIYKDSQKSAANKSK